MGDFTAMVHLTRDASLPPNWGDSMTYWSPLRRTLFIVAVSAGSWAFVIGLGYMVTRLI